MGSRSVVAAIMVSLVSLGCAGFCYMRAAALNSEARWLLERGNAQALQYAENLDNTLADAQLKTFAARRTVMERAHVWKSGQMIGLMVGALSALAAYLLYLLRRLDSQLDDAAVDTPVELATASEPPSSEGSSRLVATPHR